MSRQADGKTVSVSRFYPSSPETTFDAWINPASIEKWFGPPGYQAKVLSHDCRKGGVWRFMMVADNGESFHHFGTFLDIDPPRRLVFSWASEEQVAGWRDASGNPTRVTVEFEPRDGGVEVRITHENLQTDAARKALTGGWRGSLERLAVCFANGANT
ncbi:MAG: SRPBCC domain-containing protein [Alphaproteobacteria bacterium]|nr:SRPBCC domain-containing protein [Alphaproteobacteria bacterium]